MQTNKTAPSDSPFKALLDIFTEDFLTVLTAPEWPAAELLLRSLIKNLYVCIDGDNHGAQVKNVALDAVGQIAAKIRAVRKKLGGQLSSQSEEDTDAMALIARVAEYSTGPSLTMQELTDLQETYRIVWAKSDSGMRMHYDFKFAVGPPLSFQQIELKTKKLLHVDLLLSFKNSLKLQDQEQPYAILCPYPPISRFQWPVQSSLLVLHSFSHGITCFPGSSDP